MWNFESLTQIIKKTMKCWNELLGNISINRGYDCNHLLEEVAALNVNSFTWKTESCSVAVNSDESVKAFNNSPDDKAFVLVKWKLNQSQAELLNRTIFFKKHRKSSGKIPMVVCWWRWDWKSLLFAPFLLTNFDENTFENFWDDASFFRAFANVHESIDDFLIAVRIQHDNDFADWTKIKSMKCQESSDDKKLKYLENSEGIVLLVWLWVHRVAWWIIEQKIKLRCHERSNRDGKPRFLNDAVSKSLLPIFVEFFFA